MAASSSRGWSSLSYLSRMDAIGRDDLSAAEQHLERLVTR